MAAPRAGHHGTINQSSALLIKNSLRFDANNNVLTYNVTTGGNRTTWTFSGWFKRCSTGGEHNLWSAAPGAHASNPAITYLDFNDADKLIAYSYHDGAEKFRLKTDQVFRDLNAWYHIVWRYDTTLATADDRIRLYVNGVQITDFEQRTNPAQNYESKINDTIDHTLGEEAIRDRYDYNGYMAEVHFVDGTSLDPSYFGFTDPLTNTWRPKKVQNVSYGTNGFHLDFSDPNNIGADRSGTGTNFTPNNFEVDDVVPDSPSGVTFSTTSPGITTSQPSNYCTLNPLDEGEFGGGLTVSDGNLKCVSTSSDRHVRSTFFMPTSGKYYFEMIATVVNSAGYLGTGLYHATGSLTSTAQATPQMRVISANGYKSGQGSSSVQHGDGFDDRDIIGIAVDMDNGKIFACDNGSWMTSSDPVTGANPMYSDLLTAYSDIAWSPVCTNWQSGNTAEFNFGQFPMAFAPGTSSATEYFNAISWTGDNTDDRSISVGFQPDFVWYKRRNLAASYLLFDSVRGATKALKSNAADAENTEVNALQAFESDGFQVGSDANSNSSSYTYVAYCWKAGGTASANTDGTINSSVSANNAAGFSVVTFTGTGSAGTVGHGLDTAPSLILLKNRDSIAGWRVYLSTLSSASKYLVLDTNAAEDTANSVWNDTAPTSSVFSVGDGTAVNNLGDNLVAYCWAEKAGVNRIGTYVGDGNTVGPAVDVGFKPAMVIIKKTDTASEWAIYDHTTTNARNGAQLRADATDAENTNLASKVILTNYGFKILTSDSAQNGNGVTYSYIAFAENFVPDERYKELCTANLPRPTKAALQPDKYFDTVLWTGNQTARTISMNSTFTPDFIWIKNRTFAYNHALQDIVRGYGPSTKLNSNTATQENSANTEPQAGYVESVAAGSFNINASATAGWEHNNVTGHQYIAWCWKAGGAAVSNTDGSITSSVSANQDAGFSIVTYAGQSSNFTWGHGLGKAPSMVFITGRNNTTGWSVYHKAMGPTYRSQLNQVGKQELMSYFQNTSPTDTVFSVTTNGGTGASGVNYIAYCWSEIEGFSKAGKWTGNGNVNGPYVHCGFRPAFIILKNYAGGSETDWIIQDSTRNTYNPVDSIFRANTAQAEATGNSNYYVDFLSNGFKIRTSSAAWNELNSLYLFMAFAETPTNNLFGGQANAR